MNTNEKKSNQTKIKDKRKQNPETMKNNEKSSNETKIKPNKQISISNCSLN